METQKTDEKVIKGRNQARSLRRTLKKKQPTNYTHYFMGQMQDTKI